MRLMLLILSITFFPMLAWSEEVLQVVSSISPISSLVRRVGQQHVVVSTIISGQSDAHGFELKPSQLKALYRSDLIVHNGFGLEAWVRGFDAKLKSKLLELSGAVPDAGWNMHTWLDPLLVVEQVRLIAGKLCDLQAANCTDFKANAEAFITDLHVLNQSLQAEISGWKYKTYVSYHRSWEHFSKRYGLRSVGEFQVTHSTETTIKKLKEVVDVAKTQNVRVFWLDAQASADKIASVVRDADLSVVVVDELGSDTEDYLNFMRRNVQAMSVAMKGSA